VEVVAHAGHGETHFIRAETAADAGAGISGSPVIMHISCQSCEEICSRGEKCGKTYIVMVRTRVAEGIRRDLVRDVRV
jgi:hypothetical protein